MSKNTVVTAKAAKKSPGGKKAKGGKRKIRSITIEPADNGFTADTHYHPEDPNSPFEQPERKIFTSHKHVAKHVLNSFAPEAPMAEPDGDEGMGGPGDEDGDEE